MWELCLCWALPLPHPQFHKLQGEEECQSVTLSRKYEAVSINCPTLEHIHILQNDQKLPRILCCIHTVSQQLRLQTIVPKFSSPEGICRKNFEENVIVFLLFHSILVLLKGETMHLKRKTWRGDPIAITLESWEVENEKAIGLSFTTTMALYERD